MNGELISVIIPIYNVEKYLRECLDSVLAQTYKNLEIILVDDGSTDGCGQICDEYAKQDKRVRVIHQPNGGCSSARNTGLDTAKGELLGFIDPDDYILPAMYEKLYAALNEENADLSVCSAEYFGIRKNLNNEGNHYQVFDEVLTQAEAFKRLGEHGVKFPVVVWNKLYKKDIFKELRFPLGKIHNDTFIIHRVIGNCGKIVTISDYLYMHRLLDTSIQGKAFGVKRLDGIDALWDRYNYFLHKGHEYKTYIRDVLGILRYRMNEVFYHLSFKEHKDMLKPRYRKILRALLLHGALLQAGWLFINRHKCMFNFLRWSWRTVTLKNINNKPKWSRIIKSARKKNKPLFVTMENTSDGNTDQAAVSVARNYFLQDFFRDYKLIEVNETESEKFLEFYKQKAIPSDTVIVHGGKCLGTLWFVHEQAIRKIITSLPDSKIVILPQSIYFENTKWGREELLNTKRIWQQHNNLTVCLREQQSYEFARKNLVGGGFKNIELVPDIVLYMNKTKRQTRKGVLFCLRHDKEKVLSTADIEKLSKHVNDRGLKVKFTDTVIKTILTLNARRRRIKVNKKLKEFRSAKLVITDRLYGMIFAAVTGTPCIAFNNRSKSIENLYEQFKEFSYIKFAAGIEDVCIYADEFLQNNVNYIYDNTQFMPHFNKLADILKGAECKTN